MERKYGPHIGRKEKTETTQRSQDVGLNQTDFKTAFYFYLFIYLFILRF